eukprot:g996.t1
MKGGNVRQKTESEKLADKYSGFAPFTLMSYSRNPAEFCRHNVAIHVDSDPLHCFQIWNDWDKLLDFINLIGELVIDQDDPTIADIFCYYRYGHHPVTQNLIRMKKIEVKESEFIKFASVYGMPLKGIVEFNARENGTVVNLRFEHPMPQVLVREKVGVLGVESHMNRILQENLETFKKLSEGELEFSEEKYDIERAQKELNELKDAFLNSGWLSEGFKESPYDMSDLGHELTDYEFFGDE